MHELKEIMLVKLFYVNLLKKHQSLTYTIFGFFVYCEIGTQIIISL